MIKDFTRGQEVNDAFLVNDISFGTNNKQQQYARGVLGDSSGQIPFVHWDITEEDRENWNGKAVMVKGVVDDYRDKRQVKVFKTAPPDLTVVMENLYRKCPTSQEQLWKQINQHLTSARKSTKDKRVHKLIDDVISWIGEDISFTVPFSKVPGGKRMHHCYVGGLLEHTASVMRIALNLTQMNSDICHPGVTTVAAFLHDVGKIEEYEVDGTITPAGKLKGHITMGAQLATECLFEWEVDQDIFDAVLHMIYSHHGKPEWGSPVEPKTADAMILHMADMIDSRLWAVRNESLVSDEGWYFLPIFGYDVLVGPMAGPYKD